MNINGITNSMNFGLTKTKKYKQIETILINNENGQKNEAKTLARIIQNSLSNKKAVLDYDKFLNRFIVTMDKDVYDVGLADKNQPLKTLNNLYTHIWSLEHNNGIGCKKIGVNFVA